jgi:hypothetical protein
MLSMEKLPVPSFGQNQKLFLGDFAVLIFELLYVLTLIKQEQNTSK